MRKSGPKDDLNGEFVEVCFPCEVVFDPSMPYLVRLRINRSADPNATGGVRVPTVRLEFGEKSRNLSDEQVDAMQTAAERAVVSEFVRQMLDSHVVTLKDGRPTAWTSPTVDDLGAGVPEAEPWRPDGR